MKKIIFSIMVMSFIFASFLGLNTVKVGAETQDEIIMNTVFSHYMVLQREKPVEIYGNTTPNLEVSVTFKDQIKTTVSDENGNFSVNLDPMQADATGSKLVIEAGNGKRTFENVLVGEVYCGSGQSNMAYGFDEYTYVESLMKTDPSWGSDYEKYKDVKTSYIDNFKAYKKYNLIRVYTQKMMPETNGVNNKGVQNTWIDIEGVFDLDYVSHTAIAFAIHLSQKLGDIPVGIMVSAVGGSQIHEWISKEATAEIFPGNGSSTLAQRYSNMLLPMGRFTIRGVLWYQGESDVYGNLETYRECFGVWLDETRDFFNDENLPIITFQLPQYEDVYCKGLWPAFRQLQEELANDNKNVYYVCAIDLGDHNNIHPLQKWEQCERAAGLALKYIYNKEYGGTGSYGQNPTVGNLYRKTGARTVYMRFNDAKEITVSEGVTRGLKATTNGQSFAEIDTFEQVDKNTVAFNTKLKYISYLQNNIFDYDTAFIYNEYGLPVAPFVDKEVQSYDYDVVVKLEGCKTDGFERYFAMAGDNITFKLTPEGDEFVSFTVNGQEMDFGDGTVTLSNVSEDMEIVAKFKSAQPIEPEVPDDSGDEDSSSVDSTLPEESAGENQSSNNSDTDSEKKGCKGYVGITSAFAMMLFAFAWAKLKK